MSDVKRYDLDANAEEAPRFVVAAHVEEDA